jgi:hypothetical protein
MFFDFYLIFALPLANVGFREGALKKTGKMHSAIET